MRAAIMRLTIAVNAEEDIEVKDVFEFFKDFCGEGVVKHELTGGNGEVTMEAVQIEAIETD